MAAFHIPTGFKFRPTEEELLYYLRRYAEGHRNIGHGFIHESNVYQTSPWQLPRDYLHGTTEKIERYYFTHRKRVNADANRRSIVNRTAGEGYWHYNATRPIRTGSGRVIGRREQHIFKRGTGKNSMRTDWIMHEYTLHSHGGKFQDTALCRIYEKNRGRRKAAEQQALATSCKEGDDPTAVISNGAVEEYDQLDRDLEITICDAEEILKRLSAKNNSMKNCAH